MGGKSGEEYTVGYRYYVGMHHALCHGPVDALLRVRVDEKEAWAGTHKGGRFYIENPNLFGGDEREGGITGAVDFEKGGPDQTQNDYLAKVLDVGLLPAFRGVCAAVLRQVYMGINPYLKNWEWRVSRIHVRGPGLPQWYDEKAEVISNEYIDENPFLKSVFGLPVSIWGSDDLHMVPGTNVAYHCAGGRYFWKMDLITHEVAGTVEYEYWSGCRCCLSPDGSKLYFQTNDYGLGCIDTETAEVSIGVGRGWACCNLIAGDKFVYGGSFLGGSDIYVYNRETLAYIGKVDNADCQQGDVVQVSLDPDDDTVWSLETNHWAALSLSGSFIIHNSNNATIGFWDISEHFPAGAKFLCYDSVTRCCFVSDGQKLIKWSVDSKSTVDSMTINSTYMASGFEQGIINGELCIVSSWNVLWISAETLTVNRSLLLSDYSVSPAGWLYDPYTDSVIVADMGGSGICQLQYKKSAGDMNPAHIIRECLTDTEWGMGYPESDIDDASFTNAANALYGEGMGISILWEQSTDIESFVTDILRHIDGSIYTDRNTGKFVLKLIRADYDVDTILELDESNVTRIENFTRQTMAELVNEVVVKYWHPREGQTKTGIIQDIALVQAMGMVSSTTVDYPGFTNADIAYRVAQRDLKTLSVPHLSCEVYTNRIASGLNIGDVFKLSWKPLDIESLVMRIASISMGGPTGHEIRLECVQDVFSLPDMQLMGEAETAWEPPPSKPVKPVAQLEIEVPYIVLVQQTNQDQVDSRLTELPELGYIGAAGVRPNYLSINARLYTNSGDGYTERGLVDFCPSATLVSDIGYTDTIIALDTAVDIDLVKLGSFAQIDNEIVVIEAISETSVTVRRGIFDTTPAKHLADARLYCWDTYSKSDKIEYVSGEVVSAKLCTVMGSGILPLSTAWTTSVTLNKRAIRPYPPGNLKVNAVSYPNGPLEGILSISWNHRDRTQQTSSTYEDYTYGNIGPETGVVYRVRGYADDVLIWTEEPITGTSTTWSPSDGGTVRIEVDALRDGHYSWQPANCEFEYIPNFDVRTTEEGKVRTTQNKITRRLEEI